MQFALIADFGKIHETGNPSNLGQISTAQIWYAAMDDRSGF
jgi:hypothetical protein